MAKSKVHIQNYGLLWDRYSVDWDGRKMDGKLTKGASAPRKGESINFWDQAGIYILYQQQSIVYIGQAGIKTKKKNWPKNREQSIESGRVLGFRLKDHTLDELAGKWDKFSWFGFKAAKGNRELGKVPKGGKYIRPLDELYLLEAVLITISGREIENKQGGAWSRIDVARYAQTQNIKALEKNRPELYAVLPQIRTASSDISEIKRELNAIEEKMDKSPKKSGKSKVIRKRTIR